MPTSCNGICVLYQNIGGGHHSVYQLGFKRCTECGIYIKYLGIRCPCCGCVLRTKGRKCKKKTAIIG